MTMLERLLLAAGTVLIIISISLFALEPTGKAVAVPAEMPEAGEAFQVPPTGLAAGSPPAAAPKADEPSIKYHGRGFGAIRNISVFSSLYDGFRWGPMPIRYNISSKGAVLPENYRAAILRGLKLWEDISNGTIKFEEAGEGAQLRISFEAGYYTWNSRRGEAQTRGGYRGGVPYVTSADLRMNLPNTDCQAELYVAHEVGHVLGLKHSAEKGSVMYSHEETCIYRVTQDVNESIASLYIRFPNKADLRIRQAFATRTGRSLEVFYDIENAGVADSGSFDLAVFSESDEVGRIRVKGLSAGGIIQGNAILEIPFNRTPVAFRFFADDRNEVAEIDEENNGADLYPQG